MHFGRVETQDNARVPTQEMQTAVNTTTKHRHNKSQSISGQSLHACGFVTQVKPAVELTED